MASIPTRVPVPGSDRAALPGARSTGPVDPGERIQVTVLVRPRTAAQPSAEAIGSSPPSRRHHLTREEFSSAHGADASDLTKVEAFAHEHGLDVTEISAARRSVVLSGTVAAFSDAFDVALERYVHPGGTYRGRTGPVHVPAALADVVQGVFGLDDRPQAKPHNRRRNDAPGAQPHAAGTSYTPLEVARLYNFPDGDGRGQCIGIIELGGGYRAAELKSYFAKLGVHAPHVTAVSVDGAHNTPGVDTNADGEVLLDIEVAGAIAPGARLAVYFAPNTDSGFLDAITKAVHDTHRRPSVISISWGGPESSWTAQSLQAYDQALQAAAVLGVTVCCASGDNGSGDGVGDGVAHVDFPASSPHALACGGTKLESASGTISGEVVWNEGNNGAGGGGVSDVFALPAWQNGAHVPASANAGHNVGRGVPDVAGDADPNTGYQILVDGQWSVFGGTSAVAPLWAALIALINQQLGQPVGYLNPLLYGQLGNGGAFHDIVSGDIGAYAAATGWDACSGLGSPDGTGLLAALRG